MGRTALAAPGLQADLFLEAHPDEEGVLAGDESDHPVPFLLHADRVPDGVVSRPHGEVAARAHHVHEAVSARRVQAAGHRSILAVVVQETPGVAEAQDCLQIGVPCPQETVDRVDPRSVVAVALPVSGGHVQAVVRHAMD